VAEGTGRGGWRDNGCPSREAVGGGGGDFDRGRRAGRTMPTLSPAAANPLEALGKADAADQGVHAGPPARGADMHISCSPRHSQSHNTRVAPSIFRASAIRHHLDRDRATPRGALLVRGCSRRARRHSHESLNFLQKQNQNPAPLRATPNVPSMPLRSRPTCLAPLRSIFMKARQG